MKLFRVKKELNNMSHRAPDYEGFDKINGLYYYLVGWFIPNSSDLNITIKQVDNAWLEANPFNAKKFKRWLES